MPKIDPNLSVIRNFPTPLTEGERKVLDYFIENLPDNWEIYVQPPMNGLRPDLVLLNPTNGVVIVEIKDWANQTIYWHDEQNLRLYLKNPHGKTCLAPSQPIDKINLYKDEIKSFHAPSMSTRQHFSLITGMLIFTNWSPNKVNEVFGDNIRQAKYFSSNYSTNLIRCGADLDNMSVNEFLPSVDRSHGYMSETIASELRDWLSSSEFDTEQTRFPRLNGAQTRLVMTRTQSGFRRIKGAAGSGKSVVLAGRAAQLAREGKRVLLLTFNITLTNYLRDLAVRYDRTAAREIEFLHYHGFAKRICVQFGYRDKWNKIFSHADQNRLIDSDDNFTLNEKVPALLLEVLKEIKSNNPEEYAKTIEKDAILVDEGQDFNISWWASLRGLLTENGEMVLAADPTQDVYETASKWTDEAMLGAGFSGNWAMLEDCYRLPEALMKKTNDFASRFLSEKSERIFCNPQKELFQVEPAILKWKNISPDKAVEEICSLIQNKILPKAALKHKFKALSMSDIVFLTPSNVIGRAVVEQLKELNIRVIHTFDADKDVQRKQKLYFFKGSEKIKGSSIHSFKGLESRAIIIYLQENKSQRDIHATYAALTRLKASSEGSLLYVLSSNNQYAEYGKTWLGENMYRQMYPLLEIKEDETDISYQMLFGECLEGADEIELHDPYIKSRHQFVNLGLFIKSIRAAQPDNEKIIFKLITSHYRPGDKFEPQQQEQALGALKKFFIQPKFNIELCWERKPTLHDRCIKTNHGWHITLGRGLDIYKPPKNVPADEEDVSERQTYAFTVNYVKSSA